MTTRVEGCVVRRPLNLTTFADITGPDVRLVTPIRSDYLEFDGDLTAEQQTQIWERMTSLDDADQAARESIRAARDTLLAAPAPETLEDAITLIELLRTAVLDGLNYFVGDTEEAP